MIFDNIAEEFQNRLRTLKCELIKKLDIKKLEIKKLQVITEERLKIKKLQVITEENESESESDNESKQLRYDPNTGQIFEIYQQPTLKKIL